MSRFVSDTGGGDFQPAPVGTHVARCVELVDIGTHHGEYQGAPTVRDQVIVRWELPDETIDIDGIQQPMLVSKFYTKSLGEKANLRKDLASWRGREFTQEELDKFDLQNILGKPCLLTVIHTEKKKAKVNGVSGMVKDMKCPPAVNPLKAFWMDEWNGDIYNPPFSNLPKGFQDLIKQSDEYKELMSPSGKTSGNGSSRPADGIDPDDVPFIHNACMFDNEAPLTRRMRRVK